MSLGQLSSASAISLISVAFPKIDPSIIQSMVKNAEEIELLDSEEDPKSDDEQVKRLLKAVGYGE